MNDTPHIEGLRSFSEALRLELSSARIDFVVFPSGAAMLDVVIGDRLFVLESGTNGECGVSEVRKAEGFIAGHRFTSLAWQPAAKRLQELVEAADRLAETTVTAGLV